MNATLVVDPTSELIIDPSGATVPVCYDKTLIERWHLHNYSTMKARLDSTTTKGYLVESLIPMQQLTGTFGDSGLGKSPLHYQLGICIAAGIPFLGHPVQQGRVLYLDFENGLEQIKVMMEQIAGFLGLSRVPDDILVWPFNDSPDVSSRWEEMMTDLKPQLTIIDSLSALSPEIESKTSIATGCFKRFRRAMRECGGNVNVIHHLRKDQSSEWGKRPALEHAPSVQKWFENVRGAGAIVNNSDVRLALDVTGITIASKEEPAIVLRGFRRIKGEIYPIYIERVYDSTTGEPCGYRRMDGVSLLPHDDQRQAFQKLPDSFQFKDAKEIYGKGSQSTTNFLEKCVAVGIVERTAKGYRKRIVSPA